MTHYRIYNPGFSVNSSRAGADKLAADLVAAVKAGRADPAALSAELRGHAKASVESARKYVGWAAPAFKRNNGWAKLAMSNARGYLIAARAVERVAK